MILKLISMFIFLQLFKSYYFFQSSKYICCDNITAIEIETAKQLLM